MMNGCPNSNLCILAYLHPKRNVHTPLYDCSHAQLRSLRDVGEPRDETAYPLCTEIYQ